MTSRGGAGHAVREINLVLSKDLNVREKKEELRFRDWLTVEGIGPLSVKHNFSYVNQMLMENNNPFPKREDGEKIGRKVLNSAYSKRCQKHLLTALELYMEYVGQPIKFKKPKPTKRSPKYLTQDQLKMLIRGTSD